MPDQPRILLSGYYGFGNTGDEAILAGALAGFRELAPQAEVVVLSKDPEATSAQHGVPAIHRSLSSLRRALRRCNLFVSGGGGLLQDTTSWRSPLYYLQTLRMAQGRGIPTMLMAQSIGPLRRRWIRKVTRHVLKRVSLITLRDPASERDLTALRVTKPRIEVTADLSLLLPAPPLPEPPKNRRVIVCPRRWPGASDGDLRELIRKLATALSAVSAEVSLLPMQPRDLEVTRLLAEAMASPQSGKPETIRVGKWHPGRGLPGWSAVPPPKKVRPVKLLEPVRSFDELFATIAGAQVVVGMRLHSLIFAARCGVMPVGISYDPKVCAFLETIGELSVATPEQLLPDTLAWRIQHAFSEQANKRASLLATMEKQREAARENIRLAMELVNAKQEQAPAQA